MLPGCSSHVSGVEAESDETYAATELRYPHRPILRSPGQRSALGKDGGEKADR